MNDEPRRKLREIIERHGREVIENPRRLENLLRDYCGGFRREISVLIMAVEEHAVADLLTSPALPQKVLLGRLAQRLCDNLALSESAAQWSINSWAWALGKMPEADIKAKQQQQGLENIAPALARETTQTSQRSSTHSAAGRISNPLIVVAAAGGGNFTSIGQALQSAAPNSRLVIREGFYHESIVLDKNIEIVGEGAVENIVVRSADQSCVRMKAEQALIRGLTFEGRGKSSGKSFFAVDIARGALRLENCHVSSDSLSGVAIHGANANPVLRNCRIHSGADSGLYLFDNARALIENCDVYRNVNDNVAITQGANPLIKNCRIFDGSNGGIVVWGNGATATVDDCEISGHRLANVGISDSANPVFRRCKISGGHDCGVLVQQNGYGTFEECDVFENLKGEIAVTDKSNTIFRRCTVHHGSKSGVYVNSLARTALEECSIYDNADAGVSLYGESSAIVRGCKIQRNGTVAVRVTQMSRARVENCDLRGNRLATWGTEHGITIERKNNREQ